MQSIRHSFGVVRVPPLRNGSGRSFATSHLLWNPAPAKSEKTKTKSPSQKKQGRVRQKKLNGDVWTLKERSTLLKLRKERLPWSAIITHFPDRSMNSLISQYTRIAPRGDQGRYLHTTRFTDAERALIDKLRAKGLGWREIQERHFPDRTAKQLSASYHQTGTDGEHVRWGIKAWSEEELEKLLMLREEMKMDYPEIAKRLGRSHASVRTKYFQTVQKRVKEEGGGDDTGYVHVKSKKFWPAEDEAKLAEMLKNGAKEEEISETWPRWGPWGLRAKIVDMRRKIGLSTPRNVSPLDKQATAKMMKLKAKGMPVKDLAAFMPEFTLAEIKYAYKKAVERKKAAEAAKETKSQAGKAS